MHHVCGLNEVVIGDNEEKMVLQPNLITKEEQSQEDVIHNLNWTFSQLTENTWEEEDLYEEWRQFLVVEFNQVPPPSNHVRMICEIKEVHNFISQVPWESNMLSLT